MKKSLLFVLMAILAMPSYVASAQIAEGPVYEAIMGRRSIRHYTSQKVEREKLDRIALCGINAPNAVNRQNWEVRIVDSKKWIDGCTKAFVKFVKGTEAEKQVLKDDFVNMFRNAPAVIFVAAKPGRYSGVNCGMMGQNMMLEAYELGLGTCCLGSPAKFLASEDGARFWQSLGFPEDYKFQFAIAVGYADESPKAKPRDESKIRYVE